uniref:Uncharacterized protein n=1 Tax=Siphoviridae sp. ctTIi48 TaxID=2827875 RepID=A0A8S5TLV9_9CAUD|nr:MAG TPA: hypothetical protein [Siphoviridae sp. ctTIi48]
MEKDDLIIILLGFLCGYDISQMIIPLIEKIFF